MDGKAWRKRTSILASNVDLSFVVKVCRSIHGICDRSQGKHQELKGTNKDGIFWTHIAEPYPVKLCARWAQALDNGVAS
eukprot:3005723-Karenia_brevis.AAC.1